jgi:HNH endonuclease/CENP-B-like protein
MNLIEWPYYQIEFLFTQGFSPNFIERFWAKVTIADSCWLWTGATTPFGYGVLSTGTWMYARRYQQILAHRASWILHYGPVPIGLQVLHHCDNPPCCRPDHLWIGTQKENMHDMIKKGRHFTQGLPQNRAGENPQAKLTGQQVAQIRRLRGTHSERAIAKMFGIHRSTVNRITANKRWSYLD